MVVLLALAMGCIFPALLVALALRRWRPGWSRRRQGIWAALPLPAIVFALCLIRFVGVLGTPQDRCRPDACGMEMLAVMALGTIAVGGFLLSWAVAELLLAGLSKQ
jgi:hypothetical protein